MKEIAESQGKWCPVTTLTLFLSSPHTFFYCPLLQFLLHCPLSSFFMCSPFTVLFIARSALLYCSFRFLLFCTHFSSALLICHFPLLPSLVLLPDFLSRFSSSASLHFCFCLLCIRSVYANTSFAFLLVCLFFLPTSFFFFSALLSFLSVLLLLLSFSASLPFILSATAHLFCCLACILLCFSSSALLPYRYP